MIRLTDLYVSGGSNTLYKCWADKVSKFDTSSFYNWEQDNVPIFDLEERTHLLWERLGYPTSALTGMSFVVSAGATDTCNPVYFTTLSGCLAALPEVINYPILIEVVSFGQLGELNLSNKIFGPRGAIEIINRNFAKGEPTSETILWNTEFAYLNNPYNLASAVDPGPTIRGALGLPIVAPAMMIDFNNARAYSTNILMVSSQTTMDTRFNNNLTIFTRKQATEANNRMSVGIADRNSTSPWVSFAASLGHIGFTPYEYAAQSNDAIDTYDCSSINETLGTEYTWGTAGNDVHAAVSLAYGNRLQGIKIYNCNGPIFIRNFTVDGGDWSSVRDYGIDIRNSSVFLENCTVSRCKKAGLAAFNSKLNITRGFAAYRNYGFDSSGNRIGTPWLQKIRNNTSQENCAAGILLRNSELNLSSTYTRDYQTLIDEYADPNYAIFAATYPSVPIPSPGWLFCLSRNDIGIHAVDSVIRGGRNELNGSALIRYFDAQKLICELNTECGIKLENSVIDHSGKIYLYGNYIGLDADESRVNIDTLKGQYNQKEAIKLKNSLFYYNKDRYSPWINTAGVGHTYAAANHEHQVSLLENGVNLRAINSVVEPTYTSSMDTIYARFFSASAFGVDGLDETPKSVIPGIIIENNSKAVLVSPTINVPDSLTIEGKGVYGAGAHVRGNSELTLVGTGQWPTKVFGPTTFALQAKKSGLYANNNSVVKLQGPGVIARWAVDALADNNSKIEITPIRDRDGSLMVSAFNLSSPENHTTIELHATRSCLVADHGSVIQMEDLGDYYALWNKGSYGSSIILSGLNYNTGSGGLTYRNFISSGSLQFYPNPNADDVYPASPGIASPATIVSIYNPPTFEQNAAGYYYFLEDAMGSVANIHDFSSVTNGGMCVRALNESKVDVNNVHFPCGFWNPTGIVYNIDSDVCNRLFIWNIVDNSLLNAKYVSVSSLHPVDAGYFGPSGTYGVSGAPATTPDTSSLSVLDYYGKGTANPYGKSVQQNFGPFRLYFGIDPAANWLQDAGLTTSGLVPQILSQGYNFSANAIATGNVSSFYTSLLNNNSGVISPSGFYYASAMVQSPFTIKAILDDSAANTFANAKHNTVGKSGLAKVVFHYFPITGSFGGESADYLLKTHGKGLLSINTFDLEKDN